MADGLSISPGDGVMHLERVLPTTSGSGWKQLPALVPLRRPRPSTTSLYAAIRKTGVVFGSAVEQSRRRCRRRASRAAGVDDGHADDAAEPPLADTEGEPTDGPRAVPRGPHRLLAKLT
jgi:hypothetical protein